MKGLLYTSRVLKNSMVVILIVLTVILSLSDAKTDGVCDTGKFGPQCKYSCNCELSCDEITGACTGNLCKPGWYGPNCQMNNVALNKAARLRKFSNEMAKQTVDGDRENTCLSVGGVETQRLKIDLGAQVTLHHITIFDRPGRDASEREWSKGLSVVLGNTTVLKAAETCSNQTGSFPKDGVLDIVCSIRGQHLYLIKKNKPKELKICEVEAYVCADKTWGIECENFCGHCKDGTTCDQFTGVCPDGCNFGWSGNICDTDNKFGDFANVDSGSSSTSSGTTTSMTTESTTGITSETTTDMSSTETTTTAMTTQTTTGVTTASTTSMSTTGTSEITSSSTTASTTTDGTTVSVSSPETTTDTTMTFVSTATPETTSETVSTTETTVSTGTLTSTTSPTTMVSTTTSTATTESTTEPETTITTVSSTEATTESTISLSTATTTQMSAHSTTENTATVGTTTAATETTVSVSSPETSTDSMTTPVSSDTTETTSETVSTTEPSTPTTMSTASPATMAETTSNVTTEGTTMSETTITTTSAQTTENITSTEVTTVSMGSLSSVSTTQGSTPENTSTVGPTTAVTSTEKSETPTTTAETTSVTTSKGETVTTEETTIASTTTESPSTSVEETTEAVTMTTGIIQTTRQAGVITNIPSVTMTTGSRETTAVTTNGSGPVPAEGQMEAAIIAMSVIIPIALIIIIAALIFVILKKKKRKSADLQHKICLNEWRVTKPDGTVAVINETTSLTSESCNNIPASLNNVDKETTSLTSRKNSQGSLGSVGTKADSMASLTSPTYTNVSTKKAIPINKLHRYIVTMQAKKGFEKEYKALPAGMVLPHKDGLMEENRSKNRYINMISYDHSRVYIDKEDGDYINANYIDGFIRRNAYIATQGPTRNTTEDFWHMIWQEEVGKIVMLTNLIESNKVKCYKYWPSEESDLLFNTLQITLNSEEFYPPFVIRKISLIDVEMNETRNITQYHYTAWPDHGVPDSFSIMTFHRKINQFTSPLSGPMVVHCSAGIGRTGTLIAIDSLFKQGEASYYLSINQFVRDMRQNRVNMVQTLSQYTFIHLVLLEMFACNKDPVIPRDVFYQVWADPEFKDKVHDEYLGLMTLRPEFDDLDYSIGRDPVNIDKHRDPRIMAVDKYRAYLQSYSVSRTDYINAVMLASHYQQQGYILSQFPLQSTVIDLWQMLYDYQSNTVVIVDVLHFDEPDSGVFWPAIGEKLTLGAFVIHCVAQAGTRDMTFNLSNKYSKKSMDIRVLIGAGWSESQDVPSDADYWFELHNDIQKWQETQGQRPITVLCRDGGSRGALYCAISNVLDGLDIYKDVDVFHVFRQIHNRKPEVLDLKEQYEHCYEVARLYLDAGSLYSS